MADKSLILLLVTTISVALCRARSDVAVRLFTQTKQVRYQSPKTRADMTSCLRGTCTAVTCAFVCLAEKECGVYSHHPDSGTCSWSGLSPGNDTDYEAADLMWNTYHMSKVCPTHLGYSLVSSVHPALCLRMDTRRLLHAEGKVDCEREGAHLAKVHTVDILQAVMTFLTEAESDDYFFIGADDLVTEGEFYWSDGTRLLHGDPVWQSGLEGGINAGEDCALLTPAGALIDSPCTGYQRKFLCQYDV